MFWIFAAVVLILMVAHSGFRKVAFWIGGIAGALVAVWAVILMLQDNHPSQPIAQTPSKCTGDAALDAAFPCSPPAPFDPDAYLAQTTHKLTKKSDPDANAVLCDMAKKDKDARTAFFACSGTSEDPDIPASALK